MGHEGVKIAGREPVLRVMPMPADMNGNGDIFGGWVMAQCDIAAAIPAMRLARGRIATVAVNSFLFKQPISVGDIVSFYAEIRRYPGLCLTQSDPSGGGQGYRGPIHLRRDQRRRFQARAAAGVVLN